VLRAGRQPRQPLPADLIGLAQPQRAPGGGVEVGDGQRVDAAGDLDGVPQRDRV